MAGERRARVIACGLALLVGCGDDDGTRLDAGTPAEDAAAEDAAAEDAAAEVDAGPLFEALDRPALPAANAVDEGDPRYDGMIRFLWDTWGTEVYEEFPPAEWFLEKMEEQPEVFGDQFAAFGFLPDPNDDFPVGFKRGVDDPTRMDQTCALCHVDELDDGRVWLGAPARRLDWGGFVNAVNDAWVAEGNPPLVTELERSKNAQLGPGRTSAESDSYEQVVPADFPTYFGLDDRTALNYLGTGGDTRTESYFSIFTFGAGNPDDDEALTPFPVRGRVDEFLQFFGTIETPEGPAQDEDRVAMGATLFERERCNECHHPGATEENGIVTYDEEVERFPGEDDFERGSIATSGWHRILIDEGGGGDDGRANLIQFIIRNRLRVTMSDGYRATDLRGVWATAPYLHNGSVPTLEDLLRPADERPTTFLRGEFEVDTTVEGNGNEGHEFGTALTDEEREALVAYLRTL